jgi:hypothetical protein
MPRQLSANEYEQIVAKGPKAEYVPAALIAAVNAITTIPSSGNFTSALMSADGYYDMVIGLTSTQSGSLILLRYVDDAGLVPIDAGQSQALTANVAAVLVVTGQPFASYQLKITNTSGSSATVSNFAALSAAH